MVHPLEKNIFQKGWDTVKTLLGLAIPVLSGALITLAVLALMFLKTHWVGFNKFLADPAFFDNIEVTREFSVKK